MSGTNKHAYAPDILPEKLVEEIRKYFPAGQLWIPTKEAAEIHLANKIKRLKAEGHSSKEIAYILNITTKEFTKLCKSLL